MSDRERELIQQYDNAHRAYLEAMDVVRAAVFRSEPADLGGRAEANGSAKSQATKAKHRLEEAERELQKFWSMEQVAQEVSG